MNELIALAMPPGPLFVDQLRRAWDAGDAIMPVDLRLPTPARDKLFAALQPTIVIDEHGDRTRVDGALVQTGDAIVVPTSGTTGEPKGVVHTFASVRASAALTSERLNVTADDHWLACIPVAHIGGLSVVTRALMTGTPLTVHPSFDPDAVEAAARDGATLVSLVSTALRRIDTSLFRVILLGGGPIPTSYPGNAIATYGSTETGSGVVYAREPLRDVELRIDTNGQILVKSPTLFRCYRDDTNPKTADGWYPTGDAGAIHADVLSVFGRMDDVINTGGEKVWPATVEKILRDHPSISDVVVHGEPDEEWGERVVATIELNASVDAPSSTELRELVKQQMPASAAPKEFRFVESLPRTPSGKTKRPG